MENDDAKLTTKKKEVKIIYIEADENRVAMQHDKNKERKLICVHEGKRFKSEGIYELQNKRYFTGLLKYSGDLWLKIADYLEEAYDLEKVEKLYLSRDGKERY